MEDTKDSPGPRQEGRSHGGVWGLVMLLALVIYFLGVPPLMYWAGPSLPGKRLDPFAPCPTWVSHVAEPWNWLCNRPFLMKPMGAYELWWAEMTGEAWVDATGVPYKAK